VQIYTGRGAAIVWRQGEGVPAPLTAAPRAKFQLYTRGGGRAFVFTAVRGAASGNYSYTGTGGLTISGTSASTYTVSYTFAGSGGLTFGGTAASAYTVAYTATPSGGLVIGGAAATSYTAGAYSFTGTGGLTIGGSAVTRLDVPSLPGTGSIGSGGGGGSTNNYDDENNYLDQRSRAAARIRRQVTQIAAVLVAAGVIQ
jgi:hypothetical protein